MQLNSLINSQNIHQQNQSDANILMKLLFIESTVRRIRHSSTPMDLKYMEQFQNYEVWLNGNNNLLTQFKSFSASDFYIRYNYFYYIFRLNRRQIGIK